MDFSTTDKLNGTDDLKHAVTYAGSKIDGIAARLLQYFNGLQMPYGEVNNMNVIPHTRAVGSRVIRPPRPVAFPFYRRRLEQQMA